MSKFIVDPRETNRARVSNTATSLLNRLGVSNQRPGGMLFNAALGRLPKIAEATRKSLYLTTPEERAVSAIGELPAQSQIDRFNAMADIFDQQGLPGYAQANREKAAALLREKQDREFDQDIRSREIAVKEREATVEEGQLEQTKIRDQNNFSLGSIAANLRRFEGVLNERELDRKINKDAFDRNLSMSKNALEYAQFEEGMIQQTFANNMDSANFALDTNKYLLDLSAEEARQNNTSTSSEFLRMTAMAESDPVLNRILHNAADNNISTADAMQFLRFYKESDVATTARNERIAAYKRSLLAAKDVNGQAAFEDEEATLFAEQLEDGIIEIDVSENGRVQLINKPTVVAQALGGTNPRPGVLTLPSELPEIDRSTFLTSGKGVWNKRDFITGAYNVVISQAQNLAGGLGIESAVNQERETALQELRIAAGQARDAFRDDDRMSNLDALMIADEFGLGTDWKGSTPQWEARAVTVDRELRNLRNTVSQEAQAAQGSRYDALVSQRNAIDSLRQSIGVPDMYHPDLWTADMINDMPAGDLQTVIQFYKDAGDSAVRDWQRQNPELQKLVFDKLSGAGGAR